MLRKRLSRQQEKQLRETERQLQCERNTPQKKSKVDHEVAEKD